MNKSYKFSIYLLLALIILLSRILPVSKYAGDIDPALYVISLTQIANPPLQAKPAIFNQEMSFGYYTLLSSVNQLIKMDINTLVLVLNYINALFGVFIILLSGGLAKRLANDEKVSIMCMLLLTLDHSVWNWSLYGHPGVISTAFFLLSFYLFDKAITDTEVSKTKQWLFWTTSALTGLLSIFIRVDILLAAGAYLFLYKYRTNKFGWKLFIFCGLILIGYFILKYINLGYVFAPGGGVAGRDLRFKKQVLSFIPLDILSDFSQFIAGIGILFLAAAIFEIIRFSRQYPQLKVWLAATILPVFIYTVSSDSDLPRISIPIHFFLIFFAALSFNRLFSELRWAILGIIGAYLLQVGIAYYPMKKLWTSQFPVKSSNPVVVRPVPIGLFIMDKFTRYEEENRLARHAEFLSRQKGKFLVLCSRLHAARFAVHLLQVCPNAAIYRDGDSFSPHYTISTPTAIYRMINWHKKKEKTLSYLDSEQNKDYLIYYLNDVQDTFEGMPAINRSRIYSHS